ncbi:hypothetical protein PoB_002567700 [Plakobranchus ocellatus]|uniref:Uncharacterized protein n=1 Tax=Plakobranchus ocellatus TaxID=259542 RepID=A0AAV3ZX80_9GAST|nr:hypothetical protein PoB_002567700 [Plakobranchus ocellatus]
MKYSQTETRHATYNHAKESKNIKSRINFQRKFNVGITESTSNEEFNGKSESSFPSFRDVARLGVEEKNLFTQFWILHLDSASGVWLDVALIQLILLYELPHTTRLLISKIRKRQATFFGHVMQREKLENLVTTGMLEGKRSRGKQREKLMEGLTDWLKAGKSLEAIKATKDRKKWRTMIANAVKQGT